MSMAKERKRKPKFERQTILKGLLLLALLANVSWQPAMRTLDLSSETKSGTQAPAAPAPEAATAPAPAPAPDTIGDNKAASGKRADQATTMRVCDKRVMVTYSETQDANGRPKTSVLVTPQVGGGFKPFRYNVNGGFNLTVDKADVKADIDGEITKIVRNRIGSACAFQTSTSAQVEVENPQAPIAEREKIKRGMRDCRLDARGALLTEAKRTSCEIRQLTEVDCTNDRIGGKARVQAQIEKHLQNARAGIKNRLMSRDDDKVEEGEDMLQETLDSLKDVAAECGLDAYKMSRMASSLDTLRAGGETYRRSVQYDETVRAAKDELRQQFQEVDAMARANPRDPLVQMHTQQLRAELQNRYRELQMDVVSNVNPFYTSLLNAQRNGLMPLSEFSQFAQPYQILGRDLNSLSNPQLLMFDNYAGSFNPAMGGLGGYQYGQSAPNSNFVQFRQGLANNYNGITPGVTNGVGASPTFNSATMNSPALFNASSIRSPYSAPLTTNQSMIGAGNRF